MQLTDQASPHTKRRGFYVLLLPATQQERSLDYMNCSSHINHSPHIKEKYK